VRRAALGPIVVGALAAVYFVAFVGYGVNLEDEGLVLLQIARTARGELPYLDFHTGYTPGTFYLNAWLYGSFGESVLPLRLVLVLVNAATVALVYVLARRLASNALAVTAALGYAAFLPCFAGDFASFNVPYPSWYAGLFFLACQLATDHYLIERRSRWLLLAGIAAGAAFSFKPNAGVLAALAVGIVLATEHAGRTDQAVRSARVLLVAALGALAAAFGFRVWIAEFLLIVGPVLVLVIGRLAWARGSIVPGDRLWGAVGTTAAGGLLVTLPWIAWFGARLGVEGFVREVLLLGSHADEIYATPYPLPLGFHWPVVVALALAAVATMGVAIERGRLAPRIARIGIPAGAAVGAVLLWRMARIPEGLVRSIMWQAQHVGFYAVPLMNIGLSVALLRRMRESGEPLAERGKRILAAVVFSECMFVELYPRVDTMHLIVAMPSALVVGAAVAQRLAAVWGRALGVPSSRLRRVVVAGGAALALVATVPSLDGLLRAASGPRVALASTHVPVVVEASRGSDYRALNATLAWLGPRLEPGEPIFGFPALSLIPFALGHPTPVPHDYYFPGRPDHGDEAEIVRSLDAAPPRYVVTLNRRLGFFSESPAYYFLLRRWARSHYDLAARFGRYDVLRRRDLPAEAVSIETFAPPVQPDALFAQLADPDREQRRVAAEALLARIDDGASVDEVAPHEWEQLLLMRNIAETGDPRGLRPAWATYQTAEWRVKKEAAGALNFLALRDRLGRHLWARDAAAASRAMPPGVEDLDLELLRFALIDEDMRLEIALFAAWVVAHRRDPLAGPAFANLVATESRRPFLQVIGAEGLVRGGNEAGLCPLVDLLGLRKHETQNVVPSFLLEDVPPAHEEALTRCLVAGLGSESDLEREVSAWVAGAAKLGGTASALHEATTDGTDEVRGAARWALGELGLMGDVPSGENRRSE